MRGSTRAKCYHPFSKSTSFLIVAFLGSRFLPGQSLSPSTPSKEYIRFNGSIVTVENNVTGSAGTPTPRVGFGFVRTLTIAAIQTAGDLANFPVLFSNSGLSDLASKVHGGQVNSTNGFDIVFTSDPAGQNLLNWEIENYDPATGALVCWIQVNTLSHTSNTAIYMSYGNSSVSSSQSNGSAVWDANYSSVYHFSAGGGATLSLKDSTANGNNGTPNGSVSTSTKLGGAILFSNSSVSIPMNNFPSGTSATTLEGWFNLQSLPENVPKDSYLVSYGEPVRGEANGVFFEATVPGKFDGGWDSHAISDSDTNYLPSNSLFSFNQWHQIVTTHSCTDPCTTSSGTIDVYVDGKLDASRVPNQVGGTDQNTVNRVASLGAWMCSTNSGTLYPCFSMAGSADEVRISKVNRSADWIKAEYQNQNNPASFVTVSAPSATR